jgi:hypothetical protein
MISRVDWVVSDMLYDGLFDIELNARISPISSVETLEA